MEEKNYMSLAGELLALLELPAVQNQHCSRVAPEFAEENDRALHAWKRRNAALLDRARVELERASRYLALPSTPKDPGTETIEKILVQFQAAVSTMLSQGGPDAEREFCREFPKYLRSIENSRAVELSRLLERIERGSRPLV